MPLVAQLAVHKKKVAELSNWLKEFPHHRKVIGNGKYGAYGRTYLFCRDLLERASRLPYKVWPKVMARKSLNGSIRSTNSNLPLRPTVFIFKYTLLIVRNSIVIEEILYISAEFATLHVFGIGGTSNHLHPGPSQHNWFFYIYGSSPSPLSDIVTRISQLVSCTVSSCARRH